LYGSGLIRSNVQGAGIRWSMQQIYPILHVGHRGHAFYEKWWQWWKARVVLYGQPRK